jgi:hypothetical protein
MSGSEFCLQFPPEKIPEYAKKYEFGDDEAALEAGRKISNGDYSLTNLRAIYDWKTAGRGRGRITANRQAEISEILKFAASAKSERAAISVLCGLKGVAVPVASAILTAINPERYTIIDFRALEALGTDSTNRSVDYYLQYVATCRKLANEHRTTLRELDRALWQWSKEKSGLKRKHKKSIK